MRYSALLTVVAVFAAAPVSAQEFTSRAIPPEGLMVSDSSERPMLQSGVYTVPKGMNALLGPSEPPRAAPRVRPSSGVESSVGCIAQAVYHEARGEALVGQQAVADVVMNRVRSGRWSSGACGVIHAVGQFQGSAHWPSPRPGEPMWDRAIAVARAAAAGTVAVSARLMSFRAGHTHSGVRIGHQVFF